MNKWRVAFFLCLLLLLLTTTISAYLVADQAISITYMQEGYVDTENDLKALVKIANSRNSTKKEVERLLSADSTYTLTNFNRDTFFLNRIMLVFKNDKLVAVTNSL